MFRGGDYVDDPSFKDIKGKPGYNYMDVSDIIGEDKFGNSMSSPKHSKFKYTRQMMNLSKTGETIIAESPKKFGIKDPAAG